MTVSEPKAIRRQPHWKGSRFGLLRIPSALWPIQASKWTIQSSYSSFRYTIGVLSLSDLQRNDSFDHCDRYSDSNILFSERPLCHNGRRDGPAPERISAGLCWTKAGSF